MTINKCPRCGYEPTKVFAATRNAQWFVSEADGRAAEDIPASEVLTPAHKILRLLLLDGQLHSLDQITRLVGHNTRKTAEEVKRIILDAMNRGYVEQVDERWIRIARAGD